MDFVNLHQHTMFSIRDSIVKPKELVVRAKELGYPAVAVTDHGVLGGAMMIYNEAKKIGIKPILGCEVYLANRSRFQKEKGIDKYYHLTLLCMNETGWKNLCYLVSESNKKECFYHKPRIDKELLRKHNEGLIALSGCLGGELAQTIFKDLEINFELGEDDDNVIECAACQAGHCEDHTDKTHFDVIDWYRSVFGDRYYLEVQNHGLYEDTKLNEVIYDTAQKKGIKVVATGDTHVLAAEDISAHNIMLANRAPSVTVNDPKMEKRRYPGNGYHLLSEPEVHQRFSGHEEAIKNTMEIYERCNLNFHLGDFRLPHVVALEEEDTIFTKLVFEGLNKMFNGQVPPEYTKRAQEELNTIIQMTFPSYFMMISDFVRWAKQQGIPVGPGRGSAAGSLVSYALGITNVDPIRYGLSFARFLNKGRASVPQISFKELPFDEWNKNYKTTPQS